MLDDILVGLIYLSLIMGLVSLAGVLAWLAEKVPAFGRLIDRLIDSTLLSDDSEYFYDEEEDDLMNRIVKILMERDDLTRAEAEERLEETRQMMSDCEYDPIECEEIMYSELGLELDYIFDLLL
ncbi:MAG: hypothetical protein LUG99_02225 [Lachnospiraceae bacterium]|nr:hypothetical protein [Lachnospiraceae bacterium]